MVDRCDVHNARDSGHERVEKDIESITTLSEQNDNGIQDVSLIAHELADVVAELENVVRQFKL